MSDANFKRYNLKSICTILNRNFTDKEIRYLCYDTPKFKSVYSQITASMRQDQVVEYLVEYANRTEQLVTLLSIIEAQAPTAYNTIDLYEKEADETPIQVQDPVWSDQKIGEPVLTASYLYDAYVSYIDQEPDITWVWSILMPRLQDAGFQIAISGETEAPGVARVVNIEQGIKEAKRILIIISAAYLRDHFANFENIIGQTIGLQEGVYRLLPIIIEPVNQSQLPVRLSMLTTLNFAHPNRVEHNFSRLIQALQGPLSIR